MVSTTDFKSVLVEGPVFTSWYKDSTDGKLRPMSDTSTDKLCDCGPDRRPNVSLSHLLEL